MKDQFVKRYSISRISYPTSNCWWRDRRSVWWWSGCWHKLGRTAAGADSALGIYTDPTFFAVRDRRSTTLRAKPPPTLILVRQKRLEIQKHSRNNGYQYSIGILKNEELAPTFNSVECPIFLTSASSKWPPEYFSAQSALRYLSQTIHRLFYGLYILERRGCRRYG